MSKRALEETNYELIKAHILDPANSPLSPEQENMLDRITSAAKVLDKNPIQRQAVALHKAKFNEISIRQAYEDVKMAMRLYNTIHTFDYDFWKIWLINDIVKNIDRCRNRGTHHDLKTIAAEHANLIKAIGEKPEISDDPQRNEKHAFYILVQNNNTNVKIDIDNLHKLPIGTLNELNKTLFSGREISIEEAQEEMNT